MLKIWSWFSFLLIHWTALAAPEGNFIMARKTVSLDPVMLLPMRCCYLCWYLWYHSELSHEHAHLLAALSSIYEENLWDVMFLCWRYCNSITVRKITKVPCNLPPATFNEGSTGSVLVSVSGTVILIWFSFYFLAEFLCWAWVSVTCPRCPEYRWTSSPASILGFPEGWHFKIFFIISEIHLREKKQATYLKKFKLDFNIVSCSIRL